MTEPAAEAAEAVLAAEAREAADAANRQPDGGEDAGMSAGERFDNGFSSTEEIGALRYAGDEPRRESDAVAQERSEVEWAEAPAGPPDAVNALAAQVSRETDDAPGTFAAGEPVAPARLLSSPPTGDEVLRETAGSAEPVSEPGLPRARAVPGDKVPRETDGLGGAGGAGESGSPAALSAAMSDEVFRETAEPAADSPTGAEMGVDPPIAREAAQAVEVLNVRQEHWPRPQTTRILTVANQKGGVGKTTSAVNLAAALALHGLRVLVLDLDPQGNASTALGVEHGVGTPSIYDVLLGGQPISDVVQSTLVTDSLRAVPATLDLAGADIELTSQVAREYRLQRAVATFLETVNEDARPDYLIIDCPPSLGLLTLNALVAGREVLIPIQCEYYALEGLAQLLNTVELVRSHLNPDLTVTTVLLTMYDSRTKLADQVAAEVRTHFADLVLTPVIPRNVRVSEAPGFGQTVLTYDPGSRGAAAYLQAAHEIAERADAVHNASAGRGGAAESSTESGTSQLAGEAAGVDEAVDNPGAERDSDEQST